MIACLKGILLQRSDSRLIVDVGGVGYDVAFCKSGLAQLPEIGHEIFLHIYTNVREDAIDLYGFIDSVEKELFIVLLGVSGVGPKLALNLLSVSLPADFARAIMTDDLHGLTKLPGIGKKTAERLCLELKDKVQIFAELAGHSEAGPQVRASADERMSGDVISALVNLGYPQVQAREAMRRVMEQLPSGLSEEPSIEEILRLTLRSLA